MRPTACAKRGPAPPVGSRKLEAGKRALRIEHKLLAPLELGANSALAARFERCAIAAGSPLRSPRSPACPVYFLTNGVASLTGFTASGRSLEVAMIGRDGFTGAELVLGNAAWNCRLVVHVSGAAWRIPAEALQELLADNETFRIGLLRFSGEVAAEIVTTALASCHGNRTERVARWIAMMQDHLGDAVVRTTHDVIANAIGAHRPGVTSALHSLEQANLIRLGRGRLQVLDRPGLLAAARGAAARRA